MTPGAAPGPSAGCRSRSASHRSRPRETTSRARPCRGPSRRWPGGEVAPGPPSRAGAAASRCRRGRTGRRVRHERRGPAPPGGQRDLTLAAERGERRVAQREPACILRCLDGLGEARLDRDPHLRGGRGGRESSDARRDQADRQCSTCDPHASRPRVRETMWASLFSTESRSERPLIVACGVGSRDASAETATGWIPARPAQGEMTTIRFVPIDPARNSASVRPRAMVSLTRFAIAMAR